MSNIGLPPEKKKPKNIYNFSSQNIRRFHNNVAIIIIAYYPECLDYQRLNYENIKTQKLPQKIFKRFKSQIDQVKY